MLSRQQRRKAQRGQMTDKEIVLLMTQSKTEGVNYAVEAMSHIMAIVLRDKIALSKPKTIKAMQEVAKYFDSVNEGYVTIEDVKQEVKKELGLEIK